MMLLLLRMLSGASPANPYQVYEQATPVLKMFTVSQAACGFRPLAKEVSATLRG